MTATAWTTRLWRQGPVVCLRWDLDLIGQEPGAEWPLFEGPAQGSEHLLAPLEQMDHGTIVLWEKLDRIVTDGFAATDMIELADRVGEARPARGRRLAGAQTGRGATSHLSGHRLWLDGGPGRFCAIRLRALASGQ